MMQFVINDEFCNRVNYIRKEDAIFFEQSSFLAVKEV
jgi:hypothetical protein